MVYESDFYTTRRPYSRPTVTSYTVTIIWVSPLSGRVYSTGWRFRRSFDDETRSIRAQTNALLKRIHAPLPRVSKPLPVVFSTYQADEVALPPRITSDAYIHRMLGDLRDVRRDVLTMAQYPEPAKAYIGKGHLACISYAGGRPVARRRKLFHDDDLIKNEVTLLSHYDRMRQAAKSPQVDVNGSAELQVQA